MNIAFGLLGVLGVAFAFTAWGCSSDAGREKTELFRVPLGLWGMIAYAVMALLGFLGMIAVCKGMIVVFVLFTFAYLRPKAKRQNLHCEGCQTVWIYNGLLFLFVIFVGAASYLHR